MSYAQPTGAANPFNQNLSDAIAPYAKVTYLSPSSMLWRPFDVLHLHWPENLFLGAGWRTGPKLLMGVVLLLRARLPQRRIVYTVHNLQPHERRSRIFNVLYRWAIKGASARIFLNESSENDARSGVTILHGDYPTSNEVPSHAAASQTVNLLFYGQLRRYKGLESLMKAFRLCEDDFRLVIRGAIPDPEYAREVESLASGDDRIDFKPGFVDDAELEDCLNRADVVVLPYRSVYNSGVALLALSRGVPIVVPDSSSMRSLRGEVGDEFVQLFNDVIDHEDIQRTRDTRQKVRGLMPDLSRRSWKTIGVLHGRLYAMVLRNRRHDWYSLRRDIEMDTLFARHSIRNSARQASANG